MEMRITDYFVPVRGSDPVVRCSDAGSAYYSESGWQSVVEFQHDRARYFHSHPRELFWPHATGGLVCERIGAMGLRRVLNIELAAVERVVRR